jgi:hypothetical protein
MLRRLQLLGVVLGLMLSGLACGGDSTILQNKTFDYEPEFSAYTGGTGVAGSPIGGAWKIDFSRAVSGSGEILPATTYTFIAQATNNEKALAMLVNPEDRGSTYIRIFLSGSAITVRMDEYTPESDKVVRIIANGTFDLGTREVATTSYSVEVFESGAKRDGTGTWDGFATDVVSPDFEPLSDGALNGIRVVMADDDGQGDMEASGIMNVTVSGTTLDGTLALNIINDEGVEITDGTLDVSGTRSGGATGTVFNLVISGSIGGVAFTGTGRLTAIDTGTDARFAGDTLFSGEILVDSENDGGSIIKARQFAGTLGISEFT